MVRSKVLWSRRIMLVELLFLSVIVIAINSFAVIKPRYIRVHTRSSVQLANSPEVNSKNSVDSEESVQRTWPSLKDQDVSTLQNSFEELDKKPISKSNEGFRPTVALARAVSWILRRIVTLKTQFVSGLDINVSAKSNRDVLTGKLDSIEMKFDKIAFNQLFVSGGGKIIVKGLDLRMRRLFFQRLQAIRRPYVIYCDLLLTQLDIVNSKFIRNLIQLLVDTILERVFAQASKVLNAKLMNVDITKVTIKNRRLHAQGVAKILSSKSRGNVDGQVASVPFEVSTNAGIRDEGQTVFLKDIQVVLNPDSILRTVMPILTTTPIDIDIGDDFRIESLVIANKNIWVRAASVISPVTRFDVTPKKTKTLYHYDLSALLSSILQLKGGLALRW